MAPNTPLPLVKVEIGKSPEELGLHNRWHPEIPAVRIDVDVMSPFTKHSFVEWTFLAASYARLEPCAHRTAFRKLVVWNTQFTRILESLHCSIVRIGLRCQNLIRDFISNLRNLRNLLQNVLFTIKQFVCIVV